MTRTARRLATATLLFAAWILPGPVLADNFFTNFDEGEEQRDPNTPFLARVGNLIAEFRGGTVFTAGIDRLYRSGTRSWMIDAVAIGQIKFVPLATSVTLWGINQNPGEVTTVQFLDRDGTVLGQQDITSDTGFVEITLSRNTGDAYIDRVLVDYMGTGMVAIDDVSFSTDPPGGLTTGDSESSSLSALVLALLVVPAWWRRARRLSAPG